MIFNQKRAAAEAAALGTARSLAARIGWRFGRGPLPTSSFAQFLHIEEAHLLVVPTSAGLPFAMRQAGRVARDTCSDALVVSHADPRDPIFAFATWSSSEIVWTQPLALWICCDDTLWLAPPAESNEWLGFELVNALHCAATVPWYGERDRSAGYRAARNWHGKAVLTSEHALPS